MKFYNVTLEIEKMGTKVVKMSEDQLLENLGKWNGRRTVNVPTVGLIRGRSITKFSYERIVEEENKFAIKSPDAEDSNLQIVPDTRDGPTIVICPLNEPNRSISFMGDGDKVVGKLTWENNELDFTGDATEAAKIFLEAVGDLLRSNDG